MLDSTLAFMDQASFVWVRASGHVHGVQATWVYRRDINIAGLRAMHDRLTHGLLGRRVERSPLPFGRHRWVKGPDSPGIDFAAPAADRSAVAPWFAERAQCPVHPELGPSWHLGVLPVQRYGTAISLVASHTVIDGVGLCRAIGDAINGSTTDLDFPPARSRARRNALVEDSRRAVRGLPDVARAVGAAATLAIQNRPRHTRRDRLPSPSARKERDRPVVVPTATVYIDLSDWDRCAERLGGTSSSLLAGFAAKLAEKFGRCRAGDDLVTLSYPVNDRKDNDLRANALKGIDFTVDPRDVTADLRRVSADFKHSVRAGLGRFSQQERVFPLTPFVPTVLVKRLPLASMNAYDLPVGCSNFGQLDPVTACADGTAADYFTIRMVEQNLTTRSPELACGELYMTSGRSVGRFFINLRAYQPGTENSSNALVGTVRDTLADFNLSGFIE